MKKFQYEYQNSNIEFELIRMYGSAALEAELKVIVGKDHEQWVCIAPSINVSGYGNSVEEAKESFTHNIETFMEDLFKLKTDMRNKYFKSLGWKQDIFFKRRYSNAFVDTDGILQNLEMSKEESLIACY